VDVVLHCLLFNFTDLNGMDHLIIPVVVSPK